MKAGPRGSRLTPAAVPGNHDAMHTLLFLEPGHFHAALTLRARNPRVDRTVHLYARPGPERDAFAALVRSFNARPDQPTDWDLRIHEPADPERALIAERRGGAVVLAGRNQPKLGAIARLHGAGFHVLADKPWITEAAALPALDRATAGPPLAMDVMTSRHEVTARLAARLAAEKDLFGDFDSGGGEPAIDLRSVHHLLKVVDGRPLRRPPWYYDTRVQGDGLVDVQAHMADQAQWLVEAAGVGPAAGDRPAGPPASAARRGAEGAGRWSASAAGGAAAGRGGGEEARRPASGADEAEHAERAAYDYPRDFVLDGARRWTTPVPRALFRASTGLPDFPEALRDRVQDGVLALACNGEIRYRLRGAPVRQRAEWGQREPEGGGDAVYATIRGTEAAVAARRGPETGFRAELHVTSRRPGRRFDARLDRALAGWRSELPGLAHRPSALGREIVLPAALHTPHEAHFALVLDRFLDHLERGEWPAGLAARIRARYTLLAKARERGARPGEDGRNGVRA